MVNFIIFVFASVVMYFVCRWIFFHRQANGTMKAIGVGTFVVSVGLLTATMISIRPVLGTAAANQARKGADALPAKVRALPIIGEVLASDTKERDYAVSLIGTQSGVPPEDAVLQGSARLVARLLNDTIGAAPDKALIAGFSKVTAVFTAAKAQNADFCVYPTLRLLKTNPSSKPLAIDLLEALEDIHKAGLGQPQAEQTVTHDTFKAAMLKAKITQKDFETAYSSDSEEAQCEAITKIVGAVGRLPAKERPQFVRFYLLTMLVPKL
jgi:hypothetical protein